MVEQGCDVGEEVIEAIATELSSYRIQNEELMKELDFLHCMISYEILS